MKKPHTLPKTVAELIHRISSRADEMRELERKRSELQQQEDADLRALGVDVYDGSDDCE